MDILLVCSEIAPWVRKSEVAEVVASLSKTIRQVGHSVSVVVPYDKAYEDGGLLLARRLSPLKLDGHDPLTVCDTQLTSGVQLTLIQLGAETSEQRDLAHAYLFASAVAALVRDRREIGLRCDVVHVCDWFGALVGVAMKSLPEAPPVIVSVHDIHSQPFAVGSASKPITEIPELVVDGELNVAAAGLRTATCVTTVSDSYAQLLKEPTFSGKLAQVVNELKVPVVGILGGIDYSKMNPAIDPLIAARYDAEDHSQKGTCKTALQRELGLELDQNRPLFFFPGPLSSDLAGSAFAQSIERLLDQPLSLVVGQDEDDDEFLSAEVRNIAQKWPSRVATLALGAAQPLHRAMSGADFVILATPRSPLDTTPLFAQRYGTLPIALARGIYADSLVDADAKLETGHAFLFEREVAEEVLGAVARAVTAYGQPEFVRFRRRAMRRDLGWERPARRMVQVYRQALGVQL